MIVRSREKWFRMLFVWHGSVLATILPRLIILLVFSILIYQNHGRIFDYKISLNPTAFMLIGVALAIFLGFCNTAAYDRFWEARILWGNLLNDSRSLVRQASSFVSPRHRDDDLPNFVRMVTAFAFAIKHQLRETDPSEDLKRLLPTDMANRLAGKTFIPPLILNELGAWLASKAEAGRIDSITKMGIDNNLNKLSDSLGGCERIANTPIPYPYHVLLHRTVYIYCFLLPFGLVDTIGWMTPVIVTFIGYTFIALDAIVEEISDPFGTEPNDLALDQICDTIESSLAELGGLPIPEKSAVVDRYYAN